MSSHIPNYILERGNYAREYRRRSSTISRGSTSSAHSYTPALKETVPSISTSSNDTHVAFSDEELSSNFDLDNYQIDLTSAPCFRHSVNSPSYSTLRQSSDSSSDDYARLKIPRNASVAAGQQRFGVARPRLVHF
ncbi:hypothetical protein GGI00_001574 [Coemansia sp. RSA 2681]|nr:hypothetical protein GGI00_001574 [Coemansia sp. RSA 2681]KAJ2451143.1 hypothetical protein GGF42_004323 [Coemansia sp. RSA 2424]